MKHYPYNVILRAALLQEEPETGRRPGGSASWRGPHGPSAQGHVVPKESLCSHSEFKELVPPTGSPMKTRCWQQQQKTPEYVIFLLFSIPVLTFQNKIYAFFFSFAFWKRGASPSQGWEIHLGLPHRRQRFIYHGPHQMLSQAYSQGAGSEAL